MNKNLLILGASGHGKVVADIAIAMKTWENIAFLDDDTSKKACLGFNVIGEIFGIEQYKKDTDFIVAIGDNVIREKIQKELEETGLPIACLIHPNAVIGTDVKIGKGTVVMAGVVINSSTEIGKGCIINTKSSIDHDNLIEDYVHVSPGATLAGNIQIGSYNWLGGSCTINNNVKICKSCVIGAGAVVLNNINTKGTYIGVPARRI